MLNNYLNKLERKFGKFAISNLMLYIVLGMGVFYAANMILMTNPDNKVFLYNMITFSRTKIMSGEIWRVISFILLPPQTMLFFTIFILYFYWMMGEAMERLWGSFKFNIFYFSGVIGCIIAGFITGYATNSYLNLSLFLAFAVLFPNEEIMLFFILPIKVKWIALVDFILIAYEFVAGGVYTKIFILFSIGNLLLFFGKDIYSLCYYTLRRYINKK